MRFKDIMIIYNQECFAKTKFEHAMADLKYLNINYNALGPKISNCEFIEEIICKTDGISVVKCARQVI